MLGGKDDDHVRKLLFTYPDRAVKILYEKYYHSLLGISCQVTRDLGVSEDIVQEVFVLISDQHKELSQSHSIPLRGYLIKVVKYKSIDYFRRNERISRKLTEIQQRRADEVELPVESQIIRDEETAAFWALIMTFPKRERECLRLRYEENLSPDEIAGRLRISRKSVERSLTSVKKRLLAIGRDKMGYM